MRFSSTSLGMFLVGPADVSVNLTSVRTLRISKLRPTAAIMIVKTSSLVQNAHRKNVLDVIYLLPKRYVNANAFSRAPSRRAAPLFHMAPFLCRRDVQSRVYEPRKTSQNISYQGFSLLLSRPHRSRRICATTGRARRPQHVQETSENVPGIETSDKTLLQDARVVWIDEFSSVATCCFRTATLSRSARRARKDDRADTDVTIFYARIRVRNALVHCFHSLNR